MNPLLSILRRSVRTLASADIISPPKAAEWLYFAELGKWPRVENPVDLNEKLIWLQFNTDTTVWSRLADKYEVRRYVADAGLGRFLPEIYGIWEDSREIDFSSMPRSFVIKSTNGNAQTVLVPDKGNVNLEALRKKIGRWKGKVFGKAGAEPHYTRIPHRILAEEFICDPNASEKDRMPVDYKFMCYDGVPRYCLVCTDRDPVSFKSTMALYSLPGWKWNSEAVVPKYAATREVPPPAELEQMISIASRLSQGFPFVRVDLYDADGRVYFGELTFTPAAARNKCFIQPWMDRMGSHIKLPGSSPTIPDNPLQSS